ncbi:unannotated protein [freshwater metagenome]|uniref:Unannotated protein n=1 Tax=freshwater metagenome TaxID=449393 RepID=A0A6J7AX39_9ZZZZ
MMNERKVIIAAPDAKPSKPSVKFTPLELPKTKKIIQTMTSPMPSFIEVSRTPEKYCEIGANPVSSWKPKPAYAKAAATIACPESFCFTVNPSDCFLEILSQSSKNPINPSPIISPRTRSADAVIPTPVIK